MMLGTPKTIALYGAGMISVAHAGAAGLLGLDVIGVASRSAERAAARAADLQTTAMKYDELPAGADIVVGSHAHVQLGAGRLGAGYVDYGLGNFVFYANGSSAVTRSGVLLLTVTGRTVNAARWVPAQIEGGIPVPLTGEAAGERVNQWNDLAACTGLAAVTTPG